MPTRHDGNSAKNCQHLRAAQLPPQDRSPLTISTVNLEHRLCQIKPDCRNIHCGRPLCLEFKIKLYSGAHDAVIGGIHTITLIGFRIEWQQSSLWRLNRSPTVAIDSRPRSSSTPYGSNCRFTLSFRDVFAGRARPRSLLRDRASLGSQIRTQLCKEATTLQAKA